MRPFFNVNVYFNFKAQGQGLAITNFLFVMVWMFAYPAFIKFPGTEMRDFYPVFSIFNSWMGLIILIFLGLSSKRVRQVLICKKKVSSIYFSNKFHQISLLFQFYQNHRHNKDMKVVSTVVIEA